MRVRVGLPIGERDRLAIGVRVGLAVGRHVGNSDATSKKSSVEVLATWTPVGMKLTVDWTTSANKQLSTTTDAPANSFARSLVSRK
jgi:hypothetical protein